MGEFKQYKVVRKADGKLYGIASDGEELEIDDKDPLSNCLDLFAIPLESDGRIAYSRALTAEEMQILQKDPYCFLKNRETINDDT